MLTLTPTLAILFCTSFAASSYVQTEIKLGAIRGTVENYNGVRVNRFLGIPFAKPPLKDLRFKKPVPLTEHWKTTLDATNWPNICPQVDPRPQRRALLANQSEDCLYLNVWSPQNSEDTSEKLKPVFVYIHGGAFALGASSDTRQNGIELAARGDMVVVTLNYRLGPLGFLYVNEDQAPGNVGLWDQHIALEWVKRNIRHLGGNPEEVTISGESAGGMSVAVHIMSRYSEFLFKKAIVMSGPVHDVFTSKSYALRRASRLAIALGCRDYYTRSPLRKNELECLRAVDASKVVAAQFKRGVIVETGYNDGLPFRPVFGDSFLPKPPAELIKSGHFKKNSSILLGTVTNEGVVMDGLLLLTGSSAPPPTDKGKAIKRAVEALTRTETGDTIMDRTVIEELYFGQINGSSQDKLKEAVLEALTDGYFDCSTNAFAQGLAKSNDVYQYLFAYPLKNPLVCVNNTLKPCHGDDVPVVFGTSLQGTPDHVASNAWMDFLIGFVKGQTITLPKYEFVEGRPLAPYYIFHGPQNSEVKYGFKYYRCSFWTDGLKQQKTTNK